MSVISKPAIVLLVALLLLSIATFFWDIPAEYIAHIASENKVLASVLFTLLMFLATVVAPITATPAIPIAATILPPMLVGVLSVIGWGMGAVVAFVIARRFGKPLLRRFVSLNEIEKYEKKVPERLGFLTLVLLRMVIPVDALSYAIGLVSSIRFWPYTMATFIGITPFSFIFAYGGSAFFEGKFIALLFLVGVGVALFSVVWYTVRKQL